MILVAGSTGMLGGEICRLLREEGRTVQALVRNTSDPAKVEMLENIGAHIVHGDLKNHESLEHACNNVNTVISTVSSTLSRQEGDTIDSVDLHGQMNLIDAAEKMGVKRFIFISFINNPYINFPLSSVKRKVERYLDHTHMDYTVLRSNWFMETWLSPALGFEAQNAHATIFGDGNNKINWISYMDVAKLTVQAIDTRHAINRIFAIGGPESLSPNEVVKLFENIGGRPFTVDYIPEDQLIKDLKNANNPLEASFAGLKLQYATGIETQSDFHKYFFIDLTKVESYAERLLAPVHM